MIWFRAWVYIDHIKKTKPFFFSYIQIAFELIVWLRCALSFQPSEFNCVNKYAWCAFVFVLYFVLYVFLVYKLFLFLSRFIIIHIIRLIRYWVVLLLVFFCSYKYFTAVTSSSYSTLARFYLFIVFIFVNENVTQCDAIHDHALLYMMNRNYQAIPRWSLMYLYRTKKKQNKYKNNGSINRY